MKKVRKAVIPAAGLGTRVLPATKVMPKEMLPSVDKPAIQYIVEEAAAAGIEDILIITNRGKGLLEDHFDRAPELERRLAGDPAKVAMASVSWISPPAPGGVLSKMSKISGGSTQRPKMEYRENSWPGWGFSTRSVQRK